MERVIYRKTLDVQKGGTQFLLQGFETADKLSRVIEISLTANGDAYEILPERIEAVMYVTVPGQNEPSINACTIRNDKVIYEVLPITTEGIATMQLKLIEVLPEGAKSVLVSPKYAVEVTKSDADDSEAESDGATFTAIETAISRAKIAYDKRVTNIELTSDGIFMVTYEDGSLYTSDAIKRLSHGDNSVLSESYAKGGTGVRTDEDIDNAKYYYNSAKAEAVKADNIMRTSNDILEEVKLHGQYTAFTMNFDTGNLEYVSPIYTFEVNNETGQLEVKEQNNSFNDEVGAKVQAWLEERGVVLEDLQQLSDDVKANGEEIAEQNLNLETLNKKLPPELGGTGETTKEEALVNIGVRGELNDINHRLDDMGWITLGSVSHSNSASVEVDGQLDNSEVVEIPCDKGLVEQMTDFRYVLKKGSRFYGYCKGTSSNHAFYTSLNIYRGTGNGELISLELSDSANSSGYAERDFVVNEDITIRYNSLPTSDKITLDYEKGFVVSTSSAPENLTKITIKMQMYSSLSGFDYGEGKIEYDFTLELQGKR